LRSWDATMGRSSTMRQRSVNCVLGSGYQNPREELDSVLQDRPHHLHVLLRHRLLAQPGGFESFTFSLEHSGPNQQAVPELKQLNERWGLHLDSAFGSLSADAQGSEDVPVPGWNAFLEVQPKTLKGFPPVLKELQDCLRAAVRPGIGEHVEGLPFHVR